MAPPHKLHALLTLALLSALFHSTEAFAGNRIIEIRQIDPSGEVQATICEDFDAKCHVVIEVISQDTHQPEHITVGIESTPSGTDFKFKSNSQDVYLHEGSFLRLEIDKSGRAHKIVELFRPPSDANDPLGGKSLILRSPGDAFAQLEVTVLPVQ